MTTPQLPDNIPEYLKAVRARVEAATDGPWEPESGIDEECFGVVTEIPISPGITKAIGTKQNAEFIARARQDIPIMLALLKAESDLCHSLSNRITEMEGELKGEELSEQQDITDGNWWRRVGKLIGATLHSWTHRQVASFVEPRTEVDGLVAGVLLRQQDELEAHEALDNRPLNDDLNALIDRCNRRGALSLADQRELWLWLEERDSIISDYDEKIVALEAITAKLPRCWRLTDDGKPVQDCVVVIGETDLWRPFCFGRRKTTGHLGVAMTLTLEDAAGDLWVMGAAATTQERLSVCCNTREAAEAKAREEKP